MTTTDTPASATPAIPPGAACQNCGAPLLGPHCYRCGQPVTGLVRHFTSIVGDFLAQVDAGRWPTRDPRAMSGSITGIR